MADGERLALLQGHQSEEIHVQFQPVGGLLASASWDGTTRLWEPIRGRLLATVTGNFQGWSGGGTGMAIARDQELVDYRIAGAEEWRTIDCRVLGERAGAAQYGPARVAFSPDGRLIAMALRPEGVRIVRASDGAGLAHLPIGDCDEVLFLPGGSLLTHNRLGLCRWPLRRGPAGVWRIGPAEPLAAIEQPAGRISFGLAAGGRLVGAISVNPSGVLLLDPDRPRRRTWLLPHRGLFNLAISPDGRWAATGGRDATPASRQVNVWDAATAEVVAQLPVGNARVAFSPDGRWLGVGGEARYRFFRTGSWTPGPEIPHGVENGARLLAFHPGSRIAAILHGSVSTVHLVEVETGRVLASLDPPDESPAYYLTFSPDGRFLAVAQTDQRVHLWDLALIRRRLEEMGLASGLPDIFAGDATSGDPPAVERIEVEGGDPAGIKLLAIRQVLRQGWFAFRGLFDTDLDDPQELLTRGGRWERLGIWRPAVADYRATLAQRPRSSYTAASLARCLNSGPGRGDPGEAVRWARLAVEVMPDNAGYGHILGVALYREGRFAEAAAVLESNIPRDPDGAGFDWLYLAMCKQRMGHTAPAQGRLGRGPALARREASDEPRAGRLIPGHPPRGGIDHRGDTTRPARRGPRAMSRGPSRAIRTETVHEEGVRQRDLETKPSPGAWDGMAVFLGSHRFASAGVRTTFLQFSVVT